MADQKMIMKNIEKLGKDHINAYFKKWNQEKLQKDWWHALKFLFNHSFARGRRDELSDEYQAFTVEALKSHFSIDENESDSAYEKLKKNKKEFNKACILRFKKEKGLKKNDNSLKRYNEFFKEVAENNRVIKSLIIKRRICRDWQGKSFAEPKEVFLGNDKDLIMVLDILKLITKDETHKNIFNYVRNTIRSKGVEVIYNELKGIEFIGDKIAALIIRDALLSKPRLQIREEEYKYAFPVDTWVKQLTKKLNFEDDGKNENTINKCQKLGINPLYFAQGLWYVGSNSLDILLRIIKKKEIDRV
jgi:hypothetical protein